MKENKKIYEKRKISGWKEVVLWKDFRPSYVLEAMWEKYIQHMTSKHFM
jgi:hypothetical protein